MFHLMGFGDKPTETARSGADGGAAAVEASTGEIGSEPVAARTGEEAPDSRHRHFGHHDHGEHHGLDKAVSRFARYLMAGFALTLMAEGLRSLTDLLGGTGGTGDTGQSGADAPSPEAAPTSTDTAAPVAAGEPIDIAA